MQMFSIYHISYLLIIAAIGVAYYFIFRNKSHKTKYIAILIPLILALIVHFFKLLIPEYYNNLPSSLISITGETVCAVSTLTFPFIYISKNKALKDYMVVMGIISGFLTLLIPGNIIDYKPYDIEVIRFFFAHSVILLCPLFTYIFNIYRPSKNWIKHTLIIFFIVLILNVINNIIFTFILEGSQEGIELLKTIGIIR